MPTFSNHVVPAGRTFTVTIETAQISVEPVGAASELGSAGRATTVRSGGAPNQSLASSRCIAMRIGSPILSAVEHQVVLDHLIGQTDSSSRL